MQADGDANARECDTSQRSVPGFKIITILDLQIFIEKEMASNMFRPPEFFFNLGLVFVVWSIISISYDNIVLPKVIAELWYNGSRNTGKQLLSQVGNKPTV